MAERTSKWPEAGDLVIATVETVTDYDAYAKLDEFDKLGLLHVSEISSSWIRNVRDYVRERQKVTLKVLQAPQNVVLAVSKAGEQATFRREK